MLAGVRGVFRKEMVRDEPLAQMHGEPFAGLEFLWVGQQEIGVGLIGLFTSYLCSRSGALRPLPRFAMLHVQLQSRILGRS